MNKQWFLLICTACASVALAQAPAVAPFDAGANGNPVSLGSSESRFKHLDRNRDGSLSADEMNSLRGRSASATSAAHFDQLDTNHDGKISEAEYAAGDAAANMKSGALSANPSSNTPVTSDSSGASALSP